VRARGLQGRVSFAPLGLLNHHLPPFPQLPKSRRSNHQNSATFLVPRRSQWNERMPEVADSRVHGPRGPENKAPNKKGRLRRRLGDVAIPLKVSRKHFSFPKPPFRSCCHVRREPSVKQVPSSNPVLTKNGLNPRQEIQFRYMVAMVTTSLGFDWLIFLRK